MRDKTSGHIKTLDGWRAMAISMVLVAHAKPVEGSAPSAFGKFAGLVAFGELGVDVFFCISGYLICTLLLREKESCGRVDLGRFYTRRVFRILPAALVYLVTLSLLTSAGVLDGPSGEEVIAAIAFFRNYWAGVGPYTVHFWSLAVEEHFYLIIPLMLSQASRRTAVGISSVLAVASGVSRAIAFNRGTVFFSGIYFTQRTENRFDGLFCGAMLALVLRDERARNFLAHALSPARVAFLAVLVLGLLKATASPALSRTIMAWTLPLFIASTVLRPLDWPGRILEASPLRWFGRLSYSLYLWQQLFLKSIGSPAIPGPIGWLQLMPQSLACTLFCAIVSYYFIEKPMIRIGHRLASSPAYQPRAEATKTRPPIGPPHLGRAIEA